MDGEGLEFRASTSKIRFPRGE